MSNPIASLNRHRRELLLERLQNAAENYVNDLSSSMMANELFEHYMDWGRSPDTDLEDLAEFIEDYADAE
jgi:hypothetical protein